MKCVGCGDETRYNRRVRELGTDAVLGGLCEECETLAFGELVDVTVASETCHRCSRTASYALPLHEIEISEGGSIVEGFSGGENTLRVCTGHFDDVLNCGRPVEVGPATSVSFTQAHD